MLDQQDKEWIKELIISQNVAMAQSLETRLTVSLTATIHQVVNQVVTQVVTKAIDNLRIELVEVIQAGFAECATATEMAEVKAHLGSLEQRFTWMQGVMVTKEYLDERMRAYKMLEDTTHKQQSQKTARLVHVLHAKKQISRKEANAVLALFPHPQKLLSN